MLIVTVKNKIKKDKKKALSSVSGCVKVLNIVISYYFSIAKH